MGEPLATLCYGCGYALDEHSVWGVPGVGTCSMHPCVRCGKPLGLPEAVSNEQEVCYACAASPSDAS